LASDRTAREYNQPPTEAAFSCPQRAAKPKTGIGFEIGAPQDEDVIQAQGHKPKAK